jgi:hypothetical protein
MYQRERIGITKENIASIKSQQSNDGDETPEMFNFFLSILCFSIFLPSFVCLIQINFAQGSLD